MIGESVETPEALATRAESGDEAAKFAAIRVANLLSQRLQGDAEREERMRGQLSGLPAERLGESAMVALPEQDAVRAAVLAIRACATDAGLRPLVVTAMAEAEASREMAAVGVLAWAVAIALVLLIGKTEFHREVNGKWEVHVHEIDNSALIELAKFGTELLKKTGG